MSAVDAPGTELHLTIDCADPTLMVAFWSRALDYVPRPAPDGFATWNQWYLSVGVPEDELDLTTDGTDRLMDPTGRGPMIWFQPVPERKSVKNRLHLDLYPGGGRALPPQERAVAIHTLVQDLVALGARILRQEPERLPDGFPQTVPEGRLCFVMADPEDNEFCVS